MEYINGINSIELVIPEDILNTLASMCAFAAYVLPMKTVAAVIGCRIAVYSFKIAMAIIVRAKSFIPTMGA